MCACAADEEFWEHEWICHGTCSGMDIPTYFAAAIRVFESSTNSGEVRRASSHALSTMWTAASSQIAVTYYTHWHCPISQTILM